MGLILTPIVWAVDTTHRWIGNKCDDAATFLEDTAETLRWLATLTRI